MLLRFRLPVNLPPQKVRPSIWFCLLGGSIDLLCGRKKKAGVAILISDKIDFKTKAVKRDKDTT